VGDVAGWAPTIGWVSLLFVQAGLAYRWAPPLHRWFVRASAGVPEVRAYAPFFHLWESYPARSPLLVRQVARLSDEGEVASSGVGRLARIVHMADIRLSSLYPVFAVAFLWDVHLGRALERWRRKHGEHVADWMEALGQLETLAAFATLAADHPSWCFPDPSSEGERVRFRATGLGHPLLRPDECVTNDVELGPPGSVLLVTGSNMSGKSTLLRSIGLAAVMAGAGMPVCAESLELPAVRLFTSMRVQDSLEAGVSYFMAELLRLKELLERAERPGDATRPPLLYLVDEILQGTNSEERQQAGRRLIRHLLRRHAIGAVTTHDLELHRDPEVEAAADLVHFRESLDEARDGLSFDYRLRPGLATTRNALLLAERVGLTDPDAED
jgi:DNA mismatch repair ATPase MutS